MDNTTDKLLDAVIIAKLSLITVEGIIALLLNLTYIVVCCIRPYLRNQTNNLNVGLAMSSIEVALGTILDSLVERVAPDEGNIQYWSEIAGIMFYQVC